MRRGVLGSGWAMRLAMGAMAGVVAVGAASSVHPQARSATDGEPVAAWVRQHAVPLRTIDPGAPLDDQVPLGRSVGDAAIVGLGESFHGAAEEIALKHRALRLLVEQMGFRTIAWEEDWTTGLRLDEYIVSGKGDLDALVKEMSPQYRWRQVGDVLRWLRHYNAGQADKVRFVGVEFYFTPPPAYDLVADHVARTAPHKLREVQRHLRVIKPRTTNMFEYIDWYERQKNKRRFLRHARELRELVTGLPHRPGDRGHALAAHTSRQIFMFYEFYSLPEPDRHAYRDAHAARNLRWWRDLTGDKVAYWSAGPHTANAPRVSLTRPPEPDMRFASVGSFLRRWFGPRYRSISFTFSTGTMSTGPGQQVPLPPPEPDWFEHPFGAVRADQFLLDLRAPAPPPAVLEWLHGAAKTRGPGPGSIMFGGSLAEWFDVIVHRREMTPAPPA